MDKPQGKVLTFDFGGTKLAGAIVDKANGEILYYLRRQTPKRLGSQGSLDVIYALGDEILKQNNGEEIQAVGISFGGPVTRDCQMIIKSQHIEGWDYFPLPEVLSEHFGSLSAPLTTTQQPVSVLYSKPYQFSTANPARAQML